MHQFLTISQTVINFLSSLSLSLPLSLSVSRSLSHSVLSFDKNPCAYVPVSPLPETQTVTKFLSLARSLSRSLSGMVPHSDLKPANVVVSPDTVCVCVCVFVRVT